MLSRNSETQDGISIRCSSKSNKENFQTSVKLIFPFQRYMKKSETFLLPDAEKVALGATFDPSAHGFNGPVKTSP